VLSEVEAHAPPALGPNRDAASIRTIYDPYAVRSNGRTSLSYNGGNCDGPDPLFRIVDPATGTPVPRLNIRRAQPRRRVNTLNVRARRRGAQPSPARSMSAPTADSFSSSRS
jgi:hypothetical protein